MREAALRDFGVAARSLLDRAWTRQPADPWLVRLGLQAVSESLPAEPAASALILRRALTDEEIREHGFETLRVFAEQVPWLAQHDVDLVTDLYRAAFAFRDTSEEAVPMRTGVLAMTSNRRQDYDGALHRLAEYFGLVVDAAPRAATVVLASVVGFYVNRRHLELGAADRVTLAAGTVDLAPDGSSVWDRARAGREAELEMLAAWHARLTRAATAGDTDMLEQAIAGMQDAAPLPASMLARLLRVGAQVPEALIGSLEGTIAEAATLARRDTLDAYGDVLAALWPLLGDERRANVEDAVIALPESMPEDTAIGEGRRDLLLGRLPADGLGRDDARELRSAISQEAEGAPATPSGAFVDVGWRTMDEDETLRMSGIDPTLAANRRALALGREVRDWIDAERQAERETRPLAQLEAALRALQTGIVELRESAEVAAVLLDDAQGRLAEGAARLAQAIDADSDPELVELVLDIADSAYAHPLPDVENAASWDSDLPNWSWPAPRVDAARIWLLLSRFPELASDRVLNGLTQAAGDRSAPVRLPVAEHVWWAWHAAPDLAWGIAEQLGAHEPRAAVLEALLVTVSHLYPRDRDRAIALTRAVLDRERAGRAAEHLLMTAVGLMAELWVYEGREEGRAELDGLLNSLAQRTAEGVEVTHRLRAASTFEGDGLPSAAAVRERAMSLFAELIRRACDLFDVAVTESPRASDQQLKALAELLDALGAELYFASGAHAADDDEERAPSVQDRARFYREATAALDAAVRIGLPQPADYLLRTLESFIDVDPKGVIRRIDELVTAGARWGLTADSLTEAHFMPTVSELLSAHRDVLLSDAETREHLVSALSAFSRAGFPSARRILLGLDDMFR